jgi:hypothetical protein
LTGRPNGVAGSGNRRVAKREDSNADKRDEMSLNSHLFSMFPTLYSLLIHTMANDHPSILSIAQPQVVDINGYRHPD